MTSAPSPADPRRSTRCSTSTTAPGPKATHCCSPPDAPPSQLGLQLPDLRSRLGACTQFSLKPLDDDERRAVLKAQAIARGIELDDSVLDWLFARYARDLGALLDLLDRVDVASLAAQRRITIPFLRGFLREGGDHS
jgi:ATPase involved in DNA replication initiation